MAAQSIANRSSRTPPAGTDDVMLARAVEFGRWARRHARLIIGIATLAGLALAGVVYWRVSQAQREERASTELMRLERSANAANPQLATRDLEAFVRRFEGTAAADQARLALAELHLQANEPAKAVTALQGAQGWIDDSPVGAQAALLLAAAQVAAGNQQAALTTYLAVADQADEEYRRVEALENAAVLRAQAGDFRGAAELFQRLAGMTEEGSVERQVYEMRRVEAEARAAAK